MSTYCLHDEGRTEAHPQRKRRIPKKLLRLTDKEKAMCAALEGVNRPKVVK